MATRHIIALLKSHMQGDNAHFLSVAMQVAAEEARRGHSKTAEAIRELVDEAKRRHTKLEQHAGSVVVLQPRGELANLVSVRMPDIGLSSLVMPNATERRLKRVLQEQRQQLRLRQHNLPPRRKLLFIGAPGTGKTVTAAVLASELHVPLLTILLEGVITKFMGETAAKLRVVFESMSSSPGVYLFDEFDAIGARRTSVNDVGEIRRVLNSFLQFLEKDDSRSLIIAATNHPDLLDRALFRRFDDVLEFSLPDERMALRIVQARLATFDTTGVDWSIIQARLSGLSQAELVRAAVEAAKNSILNGSDRIATVDIISALDERASSDPVTTREPRG
ncbi:MAG TPA: ATP-binding protein [Terriglobales bacterium]|nr:ATP-binding protein [Terriglobales bacterium]